MKKLLAFILCLAMLFSFFVSCSSDDSPVSDSLDNSPASDDGGTAHEYKSWSFKRFIPAKEGDPDEAKNIYLQPPPYPDHIELRREFLNTPEEINRFLTETPLDYQSGVYFQLLSAFRRDGFFLVPHLDGKSLLDSDGQYTTLFAYALCHHYMSGATGRWPGGGPGFDLTVKNRDNENERININVYYLKKRYVDYAREYPFLYDGGSKPVEWPDVSDEQLIEACADRCTEVLIEGKNTVVYDTTSYIQYVCDAGYMVVLTAYGSETIDSLDIAKRLSFVKVPLTEAK